MNNIFIINHRKEVVYVYSLLHNSHLQLARLKPNENTIQNIPRNTTIHIRNEQEVHGYNIPMNIISTKNISNDSYLII